MLFRSKTLKSILVALLVMASASTALALRPAEIKRYALDAQLAASAPRDGTIGYTFESDIFYMMAGGSWVAFSSVSTMTGANEIGRAPCRERV